MVSSQLAPQVSPKQGIDALLHAPVSAQEDQALDILDRCYGDGAHQINPEHYHLPVAMTAARGEALNCMLEAWHRAGFYLNYNLILLGEDLPTHLPADVQEHLALFTGSEVQTLQSALHSYLTIQGPHIYLATGDGDVYVSDAARAQFLILSTAACAGLQSGENGFEVPGDCARKLARAWVSIVEDPERDWESLQAISSRGRESLT